MNFKTKVVALNSNDTIISQVGATDEASVHGLVICNNTPDPRTVTIKFNDASEGVTSVVSTFLVPANSQFAWPKPINLEPNDSLIGVGPDLIVLHSTYIGTATQVTQGFTGRGEWSSAATYQVNDIVSYESNSYLANAVNTDSEPPSSDWTLLAARGEESPLRRLVRTPTAVSPTTGGTNPAPNGPLEAYAYSVLYSSDTRNYRRFEVTTPADTEFANPVFTAEVDSDSVTISPKLTLGESYIWRCKDVSTSLEESLWMDTQTFTTLSLSVSDPTVSVEGASSSVPQSPTITTSSYTTTPDASDSHTSTDWEVRKTSDNSLVFSSYADTDNKESITVPFGILDENTEYLFRARHNSDLYGSSNYGEATASTLAAFVDTLFDPLDLYEQFVTDPYGQESLAAFNDTNAVLAFMDKKLDGITTQDDGNFELRLGLITTDTQNQTISFDKENSVLVTTEATYDNHNYAVCTLSETYGLVVYRPHYASGDNKYFFVRAFSLENGALTMASSSTRIDATLAGNGNQLQEPSLTRMTDSQAVLSYCYYDGSYWEAAFVPITAITDSVASGSRIVYGNSNQGPYRIHTVSYNSTRFYSTVYDGTSSSKTGRIYIGGVNGSGASATITQRSVTTFSSGSSGVSPAQTGELVILSSTLGMVSFEDFSDSNRTVESFTINSQDSISMNGNDYQVAATNRGSDQETMGFLRLSDTEAAIVTDNTLIKYTHVSNSSLTEDAPISLYSIGTTGTVGTYILAAPPAAIKNSEYFIRAGSPDDFSFYGILDRYQNASDTLTSGTPNKLYGYSQNISTGVVDDYFPHCKVLSTDRAIHASLVGEQHDKGRYVWNLRLMDISTSIPSEVISQTFEKQDGNQINDDMSMCVLSPTRLAMFDEDEFRLYSIADEGITLLDTQHDPSEVRTGSWCSTHRLSDTRFLATNLASDGHVYVYVVNVSGDSITYGTPVQVSLTPPGSTGYDLSVSVAAVSSSRGLVTWWRNDGATYGTLLDIDGDTITPVAVETQLGTTINVEPNQLVAIDSTRYIFRTEAGNIPQFQTLVDNGSSISKSSQRTMGNVISISDSGDISFTPVSPSRGYIFAQGDSNEDSLSIYEYTLGGGASRITIGSIVATVKDPAGVSNYYGVHIQPISYAGNTANINVKGTLLSWNDIGFNNSIFGDGYAKVQKFVRG